MQYFFDVAMALVPERFLHDTVCSQKYHSCQTAVTCSQLYLNSYQKFPVLTVLLSWELCRNVVQTGASATQAALEKEVRETLASWKQLLADADRIFVQASVSNARPIFGEDAALQRSDPRIRNIPFNTR